jgi:hypothetical protein
MTGSSRRLISIPFRLVNLPSLRPMVALHAEKPARAQTTSAARVARTTTMRFATVQALADRTAYRATLPCPGQNSRMSRSVLPHLFAVRRVDPKPTYLRQRHGPPRGKTSRMREMQGPLVRGTRRLLRHVLCLLVSKAFLRAKVGSPRLATDR